MAQPAKKYYTPEEYLALEETNDYKSEYYQGEIFVMSGGTPDHNSIASNVITALTNSLKNKPCRVFSSDQRILIKKHGLYTYSDALVICGQLELAPKRKDTITNPNLIVEVLSPSTSNSDRGKKFELYRSIEQFHDYLLIDSERVYMEHFRKLESGDWLLHSSNDLEEVVEIKSLDIQLAIADFYEKIEFSES